MTSTLFVVPSGHQFDWEEWPGAATFKLPIKGVFGRVLCDTDGTIGDPTEFSPETALQIVAECEQLRPGAFMPGEIKDLAKVKKWAEQGKRLYAIWRH